jgi:hypothetical protein
MRLFLYATLLDAGARVVVRTANGNTAAHAWIAPAGTHRPWKE